MSENNDSIGKTTGFFLFRNVVSNYEEIKRDEGIRRDCKKFGRASLALSITAIVLSLCMFLIFGVRAFGTLGLMGFGNVASILANVIAGIIVPIILAMYAFVFAVLQIRLNRKAIGIIGLILSIVTFIICILGIIFIFL